MSEKLFEKKVKRYLHSVGVYQVGTPLQKMEVSQIGWFTKIWGGGFQKSGIPDLLMCVNGVFIAVELKGSKGEPSNLQKMNVARINQANGIGMILYPSGYDRFKKIIEGVIECKYHIQELISLKDVHSDTSCDILTSY